MEYEEEPIEDYEGEVEFGEDAEYELDEESKYDKAFDEENEVKNLDVDDSEAEENVEYEYDEVVGARDKKPVMSKLNQRVLDKYEMDDLLNEI